MPSFLVLWYDLTRDLFPRSNEDVARVPSLCQCTVKRHLPLSSTEHLFMNRSLQFLSMYSHVWWISLRFSRSLLLQRMIIVDFYFHSRLFRSFMSVCCNSAWAPSIGLDRTQFYFVYYSRERMYEHTHTHTLIHHRLLFVFQPMRLGRCLASFFFHFDVFVSSFFDFCPIDVDVGFEQ